MKTSELDPDRQCIERLSEIPKLHPEPSRWMPVDSLVDKFCSGQINESDFAAQGALIGMPIEEIHGLIAMIREEDGGY